MARKYALVALLTLLGAALRLRMAAAPQSTLGFHFLNYYSLGVSLDERGILAYPVRPEIPTAFRGGFYPAFIALMRFGKPQARDPAVLGTQALIGAFSIPLAVAAAAALHSPAAGLIAGLICAFEPEQIRYAGYFKMEVLFATLLMAVAAALVLWVRRPDKANSIMAGLMIGISLACRSTLSLFPLVLAAGLLARRDLRKRFLRPFLLLTASAALPLIPWTLRNAVQFSEFIPFERCAAANNLFTGSMGLVGTWDDVDVNALAGLQNRSLSSTINEKDLKDELSRLAVQNILHRPGRYALSCLSRLATIIFSVHPWLTALALWGLWRNWGHIEVRVLGLLTAYFWGIHSLMSIEARYFVPLTPLLCVLAACGLAPRSATHHPPEPSGWRPLKIAALSSLILFGVIHTAETAYLVREIARWRDRPYQPTCTEGLLPLVEGEQDGRAEEHLSRGVQLFFQDKLKESSEEFSSAIALQPQRAEPRLSLAAVLSRQGRHAQALEACGQALNLAQNRTDRVLLSAIRDCRASELRYLGQTAEAIQADEEQRRRLLQKAAIGSLNPILHTVADPLRKLENP